MHGARKKHETSDVSFELQLLLEHSRVTKNHLAGITLDRRKFFDLLPHETCFNVLAALGAPQKVIVAERAFYKQFTCFYKANGAISSEVSQRTNGFVQGCSFSLQAALGLLSMWTKHVESTPVLQDTTISTGGFLDDNNMRCVAKTADAAVQGLEKAWQRSLQFDALSCIQVNNSKTSCFGNTKPCRNFLQPAFCQNEPSLKHVNSFVLVGGMVTACGFTENDNREKRVQKASNRLKRGRYAPLAFSQRVHMIQSAVMPVALFGCEIQPLTLRQCEGLRRRTASCLYKGHSWCRSPSANFTFVLPGHKVDAVQASIYHTLLTIRRILSRRPDLLTMFAEVSEKHADGQKSVGPTATFRAAVKSLQCTCVSPTEMQHINGNFLNLLDTVPNWQHRLRFMLRCKVWGEKAFRNRLDMQDAAPEFIDYESTVALIRKMQKGQNKKGKQKAHSATQYLHLRTISTGCIYSGERLVKGKQAQNATCPWCKQEDETVEHILWKCPEWASLRTKLFQSYDSSLLDSLPVCTRQCGIMLSTIPGSQMQRQTLAKHLQTMYISILALREKRRKAQTQSAEEQKPQSPVAPPEDLSLQKLNPLAFHRCELFPMYPWHWDLTNECIHKFFQGSIPENWRRFQGNAEWSYSLDLFPGLVWFSGNLSGHKKTPNTLSLSLGQSSQFTLSHPLTVLCKETKVKI